MSAAPAPCPPYRFSIVACARWETAYIVEWLNYYRLIGYEHVFLYCNDDDPALLFERVLPFTVGPAPFVTFYHHARQGQQYEMYCHFLEHSRHLTAWVSFFDIDEFLRLPEGETIGQFVSRFDPAIEGIFFNWVFFGPNGHKTPPAGNVLEVYTRRQAWLHVLTKYLVRAHVFDAFDAADRGRWESFWHEIVTKLRRPIRAVNPLGEDVSGYFGLDERAQQDMIETPWRKAALFETALIHHYAFRSEAAFTERAARGLGGNFAGQMIWTEFAARPQFAQNLANMNAVEDLRLAGFWPRIRQGALARFSGPPPRKPPLSRYKACRQSSRFTDPAEPSRRYDAGEAVNGAINGIRKFHTGREPDPWWEVDLGGIATITEIHIYNTSDHTAGRFRQFSLSVAIDGESWAEIYRKTDDEPVGNFMTEPFIWRGPGTAWARFVRVTLLGGDYLHLDQVEIFGRV